jgi:hypothetical protein
MVSKSKENVTSLRYHECKSFPFKSLITLANECNIDFYYAISPGLDIVYSNTKEVATLKRKLDQVRLKGHFSQHSKFLHDSIIYNRYSQAKNSTFSGCSAWM